MCVAIPGRVTEINGTTAKVDFNGNLVNVNIGLVEPKVDQYVLVHAGCAIAVGYLCQRMDPLPVEEHDIKTAEIVLV